MIKTAEIVSLSSGIIGEEFVQHEIKIGMKRLEELGLNVKLGKHAMSGLKYVSEHPEDRAQDLIDALRDPEVDMILCAIGGDDTYRLLPYLFENDELKKAACDKVFLGFSDTTTNHFMLHKVGMKTFYGQAFFSDVCELGKNMLPYTEEYFKKLIETGRIDAVRPSKVWYLNREDYGVDQVGTELEPMANGGFELLQGKAVFSGKILGGCIDTIYDFFNGGRYADSPELCAKYQLFPPLDDWRGRILLLESSEELMPPEKYADALRELKATGIFSVINGVLIGKPMNGVYAQEYKQVLKDVIADDTLPILCNISIGHGIPRCIIPFGVEAAVDAEKQQITFDWRQT